jgi:hypothetical protein
MILATPNEAVVASVRLDRGDRHRLTLKFIRAVSCGLGDRLPHRTANTIHERTRKLTNAELPCSEVDSARTN